MTTLKQMKQVKKMTLSIMVGALLASCTGEQDSQAEQVSEGLDDAADNTAAALEDVRDQAEDISAETAERLEGACEEVTERNC